MLPFTEYTLKHAGFFYWARGNTVNETVIWWSENCGGTGTDICYTAM